MPLIHRFIAVFASIFAFAKKTIWLARVGHHFAIVSVSWTHKFIKIFSSNFGSCSSLVPNRHKKHEKKLLTAPVEACPSH